MKIALTVLLPATPRLPKSLTHYKWVSYDAHRYDFTPRKKVVLQRISYKPSAAVHKFLTGETMDARVAPQMSNADKVRMLIAEYVGLDVKQVTDEAYLTDDLGLDWLDQLELMVLIEDEFAGVEFFENTIAQIEQVGDLISRIEHHNAAPVCRSAA